GLGGAESKRPAALSGGMRQRVGLARAFSTEPKVLLLDEPFAQIDALTRGVIQDELVRMWSATRNTVFMVTHDVDEAILLSDRIALMTRGPQAKLAEQVEVKLARPRRRADLIDDPEFLPLRTDFPLTTDPFKYRLMELVGVYGDALRERCNELFGDGILSAIDCVVKLEKKGERGVLTIDAKFLHYKEY